MSLLDCLPPRAWTDLTVPVEPPNVEWFDFYTEWLADYLFVTDIPVHERQKDYAARLNDCEPGDVIFAISDVYGNAYDELEDLQYSYDDEKTKNWSAYIAEHRKIWDECVDEEFKQEESFEEWAITQGTWQRCREEWLEEKQLISQYGALPNLLDLPFRSLLALDIKRIPDRTKRFEEIKHFFWNYTENREK